MRASWWPSPRACSSSARTTRSALFSWETGAAILGVVGLLVVTPRLLPPGTLRMAAGLPSVILSRFFLNAAFNGTITFVPLMLTQERGSTVSLAGILLAVGSLGWSAGSWIQGRPTFTGRRWVLVSAGGALVAAGALLMVLLTALGLSVWFFAPAMVFAGLGMGLGSTSLSVILLDLAPVSEHSSASASLQLSDVLGSVIGIAVASASSPPAHRRRRPAHLHRHLVGPRRRGRPCRPQRSPLPRALSERGRGRAVS